MGFRRETCRAMACAVLSCTAADTSAEPGEPLKVTQLGDPESELEAAAVLENSGGANARAGQDDFSRAINQALRAQQRSIEEKCRSANRDSGTIASRWAWEASCRYQRR